MKTEYNAYLTMEGHDTDIYYIQSTESIDGSWFVIWNER